MKPIEWLGKNVDEFKTLSREELEAILEFSLLWSLFEARVLNKRGSSDGIISVTHKWFSLGLIEESNFLDCLKYFKNRYYSDSEPTKHLNKLNLRRNDNPELVHAVLKSENKDLADCVAVLLIIVYRLRNNLFHGIKWDYGIKGQLENFNNANTILMSALSIKIL